MGKSCACSLLPEGTAELSQRGGKSCRAQSDGRRLSCVARRDVSVQWDVEWGLALVERAKQLNPNHPGWYWYVNFYQAYKQHDYKAALNFATKVNLPGHWAQPLFTAAARGQLGEIELAAKAVSDLLRIRPDAASTVGIDLNKWFTPE